MIALQSNRSRRIFMLQGAAILAAAGLAHLDSAAVFAQEETSTPSIESGLRRQEVMEALNEGGYLWTATSPATRAGDAFSITITNRASETLSIWVSTIIMDHQAHHNESAIEERFDLTAGDARTLKATNSYGQANHFSTRMIAGTSDPDALGVQVTLIDQTGVETASFNERAFWIKSAEEIRAAAEQRREERESESGHEGH